MLFPTSIIGSLPRPAFLRDLMRQHGSVSEDVYENRLNAAIRCAVALQEQAGVDVVSDGEWRRISYLGVIRELAHGFETTFSTETGKPPSIVVTDTLRPQHTGFIANEARFLRSITKKPIKVTLPSPALLGERMWDAHRSAKVYPTRRDFVRDCVPILREELKHLAKAGVSCIQIDDPHLGILVDRNVRSQYANPDEEAAFDVETINECVEGFDHLQIAAHLCRRAGARSRGDVDYSGSFESIVHHINALHVHQVCLEFVAPGSGNVSVLTQLRKDLDIGLGCLTVQPGIIDSVDVIVERVEAAIQHIDCKRITLLPDCGFAPTATALVSLDEVYEKLKREVEAAQILRTKYASEAK